MDMRINLKTKGATKGGKYDSNPNSFENKGSCV
jgi:hypothetical protein